MRRLLPLEYAPPLFAYYRPVKRSLLRTAAPCFAALVVVVRVVVVLLRLTCCCRRFAQAEQAIIYSLVVTNI